MAGRDALLVSCCVSIALASIAPSAHAQRPATGSLAVNPSPVATQPRSVVSPTLDPVQMDVEHKVDAAETWALLGVGIPAGTAVALGIVLQPGGKMHVPTWQVATLAGLWSFAGLWGVSIGYYRAGEPVHATLSGVGKTALLASAIALDTRTNAGLPAATVMTIAGIVTWDIWEYLRLGPSVRRRAATGNPGSVTAVATPNDGGFLVRLASRF